VTDIGGGANEPMAMLTGDFIFVGDVGRPDLLEQAAGLAGTQEASARQLYASLCRVANQPSHLLILPAHGAGSSCGKSIGSVPVSTLGYEAKFNHAFRLAVDCKEEDFVNFILSGQPEPPAYFANMNRVNRMGPPVLGRLPQPRQLNLDEISARLAEPNFIVLDTRQDRAAFLARHLHGSLFLPADKFSDFAGSYLEPENEIVLVVERLPDADEFVRELVRIGLDHIVGVLLASTLASAPESAMKNTRAVTFAEVPALLGNGVQRKVLDVRHATEFSEAHLRGAQNIAHSRLRPRLDELPSGVPLLVHCASGLRAAGASAFLERRGREVLCVSDAFKNAPASLLA
jgi:hydroxyacylglutathione hydrolase